MNLRQTSSALLGCMGLKEKSRWREIINRDIEGMKTRRADGSLAEQF